MPQPSSSRGTTLGEFLGIARWIVTPLPASKTNEHLEPQRPTRPAYGHFINKADTTDELSSDPDAELGQILGAIADDVQQIATAVRDGIMADFAARITFARRHLPRQQLAGALQALNEARKAALALAQENAKRELQARKKAAITIRRRQRIPGPPKMRNSAPKHD